MGNFTMAIDVNDVEDLYAWQISITYNSSETKVLNIKPGGFVGAEYISWNSTGVPDQGIFVNATDISDDTLLLGVSLCGDTAGKDGSGRLATVVFGYYTVEYSQPETDLNREDYKTSLWNSEGTSIPVDDSTITLDLISSG